jgi:hypothetical protein
VAVPFGRRSAAPGFAALAIASVLLGRRSAAPGFAALAIASRVVSSDQQRAGPQVQQALEFRGR